MGLERRVSVLEGRVDDIETSYAETMYKVHREVIGLRITLARVATKVDVAIATEDEVDSVLAEES